jgi:hypothetical protein
LSFRNIILIHSLIFFTFCHSIQDKSQQIDAIIINDYLFFRDNNIKIYYKNFNDLKKLPASDLSSKEWNLYAIYYFYENELDYSEYCFEMALKNSDFSEQPEPLTLNEPLKNFLNLLFFYEVSSNNGLLNKDKQEMYINQYIHLIQNRDDLMIVTLQEIRKRNLSRLELTLSEKYVSFRKDRRLSDNFLYEYLLTLIHNHRIELKHYELVKNINNASLKKYLIDQITNYFYKNNQLNYIKFYEQLEKDLLISKNEIDKPNHVYYYENLFIAYYKLYKQNQISKIPSNIIQNIEKIQYIRLETYQSYLDYYFNEEFLYSKDDVLKVHIKPECNLNIFDILCFYNTKLIEYKLQKEIFGTYNLKKLSSIKKSLLIK